MRPSAFEVLIGLGTGILIEQVNGLPAAERATGARLVEDFTGSSLIRTFELIGSCAWLIAVVAAGVALFRRADARSSVAVVLSRLVSAVPITWHVPPFGPVGLALFIIAMLLVLRGRSSARASVPAGQPVHAYGFSAFVVFNPQAQRADPTLGSALEAIFFTGTLGSLRAGRRALTQQRRYLVRFFDR